MRRLLLAGVMVLSSIGCGREFAVGVGRESATATVADAQQFIATAEKRLELLGKKAARAGWVQNNFITDDTQKISADAYSDLAAAVTELALGARRFEALQLPAADARKLKLLKLQLAAPAPSDPAERDELSALSSSPLFQPIKPIGHKQLQIRLLCRCNPMFYRYLLIA